MADQPEREVVRRQLDPGGEDPGLQIVRHVADIEGREPMELTELYDCVDGVLDHLFSNPPSLEAELEISFNYEGYRITVEQDGAAEFVRRS